LAWVLEAERRDLVHAPSWFSKMLCGGEWPEQVMCDWAKALLEERENHLAVPAPFSFSAPLPVVEVRGEPFAQKRNRVLNELKDAEGGGR